MSRLTLLALVAVTGCISFEHGHEDTLACRDVNDPVQITGSDVVGNYVVLDVEFGGGCEDHEFGVWWSGAVAKSLPPQVSLELKHDDHGDPCDGWLSETLWIDMSPLHGAGSEVDVDFVRGTADGTHLTRVRYAYEGPTSPPADVITLERCGRVPY